MIDHIGFGASDYDASMKFFQAALAPLGYKVVMEGPPGAGAGLGNAHAPELWISPSAQKPAPLHLALRAETRADVDAFYKAAMAAGGKDNGGPGLRTHYHPNYYGAFVIGPDGHNVEAVCHKPA
ncbi:VOC family protein [Piscinibacter gummiphilus]|uniref:VOC family protein n=1 Tax=Piscinibacter gummiphilus TaxID=946333 RepID=A0ABZ0D0G8_9BURK|nr:VOC family protein [Piscinibacter gummiphilus]WOB08712.1 VOC family protein [Piscinibacter gummiphilus]